MILLSRVVVAAVVLAGCSPTEEGADVPSDAPPWLIGLIRQMETQPVWNPPAYVGLYDYKGEQVYYVPPHCCDVPSVLWNEAGEVMCSPDGGLTGRGDGRCPDFFASRSNERIIWRDSRTLSVRTIEPDLVSGSSSWRET